MEKGATGALCSREVDGVTFEFYQISPRETISLLLTIMRLLGMSLKGDGALDIGNLAGLKVETLVANVSERLDEKTVFSLADRLFAQCLVHADGEQTGGYLRDRKVWDAVFGGKGGIMRFFTAFGVALEVYYGDFFGDLLGRIGARAGGLKEMIGAATIQGSTGISGAR